MKFLCPNCKAKYRIGSEKLVGRQAAKIRCRKCDYRIQIAYRTGSDEYDITATPTSLVPAAPPPRAVKAAAPVAPVPAAAAPRVRGASAKEEAAGARKPAAPVPGLPGLGAPKTARGAVPQAAGMTATALGSGRRPLPAPPPSPFGGMGLAGASGMPVTGGAAPVWPAAAPAPLPPIPAPPVAVVQPPTPAPAPRPVPQGNQLADQFRESVQAGGLPEEIPQDGWFVGVNGVPLGPIPVGDLRELAAAGHIDRRSLVWREGIPEWKPLGKFPQLARLLGDGGAPPSAESPPAPARANGMNGHAATGFDAPRPVLPDGERPSAWGDLDDDDDEDEQPTTVKGRVSLPPPDNHPPAPAQPPPAAAAPARPVAAPGFAPLPFSAPVPRAPSDVGAQHPNAAPPVGVDGLPASTISTTPEPVVDEADARMMRPRGRGRLYLIVLAIVTAFALGAIITRAIEPPAPPEGAKEPASEPARALAPTEEAEETAKVATEEVIEEAPPEEEAELEPARSPLGANSAPAPRNSPASAPGTPSQTQPVKSGGSLLSGLGAPPTPGPSVGGGAGPDGRAGGAGLDATAIQRTVRRYSPAVRQNCWQRALNTRAPGVPSSAKVTALITVDSAGRVQAVSVSGAPKGYPGLARCIEGSVKGWQFPRAGGETVTSVPFMFVGQ